MFPNKENEWDVNDSTSRKRILFPDRLPDPTNTTPRMGLGLARPGSKYLTNIGSPCLLLSYNEPNYLYISNQQLEGFWEHFELYFPRSSYLI